MGFLGNKVSGGPWKTQRDNTNGERRRRVRKAMTTKKEKS